MTQKTDEMIARRRDAESDIGRALAKIACETAPPELHELAEDLEARLARGAGPKSNGAAGGALPSIASSNDPSKA